MRLRRWLTPLLVALALAGCAKEAPPQRGGAKGGPPAYGDALVVGSIGEPSNLIPILASDSASSDISGLVYNGLVRYDKNLKLEGELARSWDVSPDGLTFTFHLRKGVKWHDGKPFTSHDVLYTYQVTIDPKTPTAYSEDFKQVKKAEALDPYTFRVSYSKPYAPALASWGMPMLPAHLLEGRDITKSPLTRKPIGTGPYLFKEWIPAQKVTLESNPDYWEGKPYVSHYVYRIIPDSSTMYMELKSGSLDMMGLSPVQYKYQTNNRDFRERFNKYRYPAFSYGYLGYNLRLPMFQDRRVRQALTAAINKEEIVHGVLLGMGQVAHGPYKPGTWAYKPQVADPGYDPEHAKALLKEAGYVMGGGGILEKNGKPFSFTIMTNQNTERVKAAQIIQQRLKRVGIDVKIRVMEWASFITNFIDTGKFEAVLLGWTVSQDPDIYDVWHSSKTGPKELNFIHFKNAEVDRLLEEGRSTFDIAKRKACYYRIQDILAEEQPYTFLFVPDALPVVSSRFHGIEPAPAGISYNLIKWYVPKSEQVY
jgi:peptide/nickel transport system substrate-binding protein